MRYLIAFLTALIIAAPAAAQEPEWRIAGEHHVLLSPWEYEPDEIRLPAGVPVRLVLVNNSGGTLSFRAPAFFRAARVRSGADAEAVRDGNVAVRPGEHRTILLVPASGRYRVHSNSFLRRLLGMSATILVE